MERSAWPKNLSSSRKRAIQDLLHAQNPTKKLADLFDAHSQTGNHTGQPPFVEHLVVNVLGSVSNTLSLSSSAQSDEVLQVPTKACVRSEVSEGSESITTPFPRKTSDTQTRQDQNLMDDGQQWRTYHQEKTIELELPGETSSLWWTARASRDLDDGYQWRMIVDQGMIPEFPGSYYRCAHQIEQGCQATKLVERTPRDPRLFLITYRGRHTCEIILDSPQLIPDSPGPMGGDSIPQCFNTSRIAEQGDDPNKNPIFFDYLSVNQEQKLPSEDDLNPHGDSSNNNNQCSSSDSYAVFKPADEESDVEKMMDAEEESDDSNVEKMRDALELFQKESDDAIWERWERWMERWMTRR